MILLDRCHIFREWYAFWFYVIPRLLQTMITVLLEIRSASTWNQVVRKRPVLYVTDRTLCSHYAIVLFCYYVGMGYNFYEGQFGLVLLNGEQKREYEFRTNNICNPKEARSRTVSYVLQIYISVLSASPIYIFRRTTLKNYTWKFPKEFIFSLLYSTH